MFIDYKLETTCEERENQQDTTIICLLSISLSTCFGHHYAHLQEEKDRVTAYAYMCMGKQIQELSVFKCTCSNTVFVLLKMGIMMPETC